jgi:hypothetical protein
VSQVSKQKWALIIAFLVASFVVFYIAAFAFNLNIIGDGDGDGLLNGSNETLSKDDGKTRTYLNAGILHRENADGTYTFFGEKTLGSDPSKPSPEAVKQALFLSAINNTAYQKIKQDGNLSNFNIDGDFWSNYFEHVVTGTPYNVPNDIYVIMLTQAGRDYLLVDEMYKFFEEKMELPAENMYCFSRENNNPENLEAAFNDIAKKADKNDTIIVNLGGEGGPNRFAFYKLINERVSYQWIKERADMVDSGLNVIVVDACYSGSAIKHLESSDKPTIILTAGSADQKTGFGISYEFLKAFSNKAADKDGNNHVSIREAAEHAKEVMTFENETPQLSDNLDTSNYLIELELED